MTKIFCDFCGKESEKMLKVKLPTSECIDVSGGWGNTPIVRFSSSIVVADKDICESCAKKLMIGIGMINNIDINYTKDN